MERLFFGHSNTICLLTSQFKTHNSDKVLINNISFVKKSEIPMTCRNNMSINSEKSRSNSRPDCVSLYFPIHLFNHDTSEILKFKPLSFQI